MDTSAPPDPSIRCRGIVEADLPAVAALLARGFPGRSQAYWLRGLDRLRARPLPSNVPRYGYLIEADGCIRGALLLIYSVRPIADGQTCLQCNLSSWFVDPEFRGYATLLANIAQKDRSVTFLNLTPAPNTWPILEAQGFRRVCTGTFVSCPILDGRPVGDVEPIGATTSGKWDQSAPDLDLLRRHAELGCLSFVWRHEDQNVPFVFAPVRIRNGRLPLPAVQLIYARGYEEYRRSAAALGRALLARGRPFVLLPADGPIARLRGFYTERRGRRYVRGPNAPPLCDITDSELLLFGA